VVVAQEDSVAPKLVFNIVEQMPHFPGTEESMQNFIRDNFQLPQSLNEISFAVTIIVDCVIDIDGSVTEEKISHTAPATFAEAFLPLKDEALRVARLMKFRAGRQNGKAVRVRYAIPFLINF
ncbi:MAG TPA: energy transducer TonB, partial [Chitinophagales bacterium]